MHLQRVLKNVYCLSGPSNAGLIVGEGQHAILIDTGVGKRWGQQLLQILKDRGLNLAAIFNTHCHGDHVGGNAYLIEHTGAQVYAPRYDAVVLQYPLWGTMCMFGGAEPITELSVPRFAAQPSAVDKIVTEGEIQVAGIAIQAVPLPGHTGTHTGYIVDNVFFIGDALAGEAELNNTAIVYAYSVTKRLESLEKLRHYSCARYVLGHGEVKHDIAALIERNIAQAMDVLNFIKEHLALGSAEASEILVAICAHYGIKIRNVKQYFLLLSTLHAYLSHLNNIGEIKHEVRDNRLMWRAVDWKVKDADR